MNLRLPFPSELLILRKSEIEEDTTLLGYIVYGNGGDQFTSFKKGPNTNIKMKTKSSYTFLTTQY